MGRHWVGGGALSCSSVMSFSMEMIELLLSTASSRVSIFARSAECISCAFGGRNIVTSDVSRWHGVGNKRDTRFWVKLWPRTPRASKQGRAGQCRAMLTILPTKVGVGVPVAVDGREPGSRADLQSVDSGIGRMAPQRARERRQHLLEDSVSRAMRCLLARSFLDAAGLDRHGS